MEHFDERTWEDSRLRRRRSSCATWALEDLGREANPLHLCPFLCDLADVVVGSLRRKLYVSALTQ